MKVLKEIMEIEIKRVNPIVSQYIKLGKAGIFGLKRIENCVKNLKNSLIQYDLVGSVKYLEELKNIQPVKTNNKEENYEENNSNIRCR